MKDKNLRSKAWVLSRGLQKGFEEVGDRQGEQLFETIKFVLQKDELCLSRFLYAARQFVKTELVNSPSDN